LFGCYLIYNQKKFAKAASEDEMAGTLFGGRYLLAMMGAFGVYVGLCYNDFMALSVNLFGSHWHFEDPDAPGAIANNLGGVYTFGVDPAWHDTVTELAFYNSLKMKLSVIFGITQMTFGLILSLMNHLHFNNWLGIWCEFIPQMIFMLSLFGYMIALILTKWSIDWSIPYVNGNNPDGTPCPADPPNLITTMINMFLNPGVVECKSLLYEGQAEMQVLILICPLITLCAGDMEQSIDLHSVLVFLSLSGLIGVLRFHRRAVDSDPEAADFVPAALEGAE
jgi:V-type H+-transporting ATPase subunit a